MGSKGIGSFCLQHILDHQKKLDIEVVALFTNNRQLNSQERSVTTIANENNIQVHDSLEALNQYTDIDFILSVQYHEILKQDHINVANKLAINLHMAPLPEYRGCNQFSFAIIDQAKEFGTTLHRLESGIDNGAILAENRFPIPTDCDVKTLHQLTNKASEELFTDTIADIIAGKFTPIEQTHLIEERGTSLHYRKEINDLKVIDLTWDEEKIDRYIRATYFPPFPPPFAMKDGKQIPLTLNWREEII
jgi:methionyl-tRNA formyltransferase